MQPALTEVSFIHDQVLHRFNFMADEDLVARIQNALEEDHDLFWEAGARDVQCYVPCFEPDSAVALVERAAEALNVDPDEAQDDEAATFRINLDQALGHAREVDALSLGRPGVCPSWDVHWIWAGDGDDDNAFSQSFWVAPEAEAAATRFTEALEALVTDRERAYGFEFFQKHPEPQDLLISLGTVLGFFGPEEEGDPCPSFALAALVSEISLEQVVPPAERVRTAPRL